MSIELHNGDCLEVMRGMADDSVDAIVTDPPYGIGKADWDASFPVEWIPEAMRLLHADGRLVVLTNGGDALRSAIMAMGDYYQATFAAWLCNGMKRGPISFGNWIAVIVGGHSRKWKPIQDVIRVVIDPTEKINHPSPKPLSLMEAVTLRLTQEGDIVLDPFMGSGTTGVACVNTGRNFIGIEKDAGYFEVAKRRIEEAQSKARQLELAI